MIAPQCRMGAPAIAKGFALLGIAPFMIAATWPSPDAGPAHAPTRTPAPAYPGERQIAMPLTSGRDTIAAGERSNLGHPMVDAELGDIRGKYISPDAVSYFGISMLTSWQDEAGITTAARLAFAVDFIAPSSGGSPVPHLFVSWTRDGDLQMDVAGTSAGYTTLAATPAQIGPVGALSTLGGAGQVHVIAGADNVTDNTLRFAVVPRSAIAPLDTGGMQHVNGSSGTTFDDGDSLLVRMGDNTLSMALTGNGGRDSTLQMIGGDLGHVLQQTILNSDNNTVMNSTTIMFGVSDQLRDNDRVSATGAMASLKGFGL